MKKVNDFLDREGFNSKEKDAIWALAYLTDKNGGEPKIPVDFGVVYRIRNKFEVRSTFNPFDKDKIWGVKFHGLTVSYQRYPCGTDEDFKAKGERWLTPEENEQYAKWEKEFDDAFKFLKNNGVQAPISCGACRERTTIDDSDWSENAKKRKHLEIYNRLKLDFKVVYRNDAGDVATSEVLEKIRAKALWGIEIAGIKLSLQETPDCKLLYSEVTKQVARKNERFLSVDEWKIVHHHRAAFCAAIELLNEVLEKRDKCYSNCFKDERWPKLEGNSYPTSEIRTEKKRFCGPAGYITRYNFYTGQAYEEEMPNYLSRTRTTLL